MNGEYYLIHGAAHTISEPKNTRPCDMVEKDFEVVVSEASLCNTCAKQDVCIFYHTIKEMISNLEIDFFSDVIMKGYLEVVGCEHYEKKEVEDDE